MNEEEEEAIQVASMEICRQFKALIDAKDLDSINQLQHLMCSLPPSFSLKFDILVLRFLFLFIYFFLFFEFMIKIEFLRIIVCLIIIKNRLEKEQSVVED